MMKDAWKSWARSVVAIAGVYGYFLIFAQFALVEIMRGGGVGAGMEKVYLGLMAVMGVGAGFWVGLKDRDWVKVMRVGMGFAGVAAGLAAMVQGPVVWAVVAVLTGGGLGVATVAMAAWLPRVGPVWVAGVGTGFAYGLCNVPVFFTMSPTGQAVLGCGFAVMAMMLPRVGEVGGGRVLGVKVFFPAVVVVMMALVWMDSAAFFVIQHAEDLKASTWGREFLWRNAVIHFGFAVLAGWGISRGQLKWVLVAAWVLLSGAALGVNASETRGWAGCLYPAAVSMYSTVLIAWPGWMNSGGSVRKNAVRAAWLFGVAGWFGSANGIGMVQALQRVPVEFVVAAAAVFLLGMVGMESGRWRQVVGMMGVMAVAWASWYFRDRTVENGWSAEERGRQVYLSEGCIHCHSQYQRPVTADLRDWLLASDGVEAKRQVPVLIGNRRQGPDLSMVGVRRSSAWLAEHFKDPEAFSPGTMMPSYRRLFESDKGDALVKYMASLGQSRAAEYQEKVFDKKFPEVVVSGNGRELYVQHCAVCHGVEGRGDGKVAGKLRVKPVDLVAGPFRWTGELEGRDRLLARVVQYGIGGTDMPGHEVLSDGEVRALVDELKRMRSVGEKGKAEAKKLGD